jgi:hypothetical protein
VAATSTAINNKEKTMKAAKILALPLTTLALWGCGSDSHSSNLPDATVAHTGMVSTTADCEFDVVAFTDAGGPVQEVHINGLVVADLPGADKVTADTWEVVTRRGVRFADILAKAGVTATEDAPVNCVARDGFDPLRTKLANDTTKLPTFAFLRDHGYVYVGSPGDKDPLYPTMEGKSLIVDYDPATDAEVPASLGGKLSSLGMFRWKMIEKIDEQTRGIVEISPVVQ